MLCTVFPIDTNFFFKYGYIFHSVLFFFLWKIIISYLLSFTTIWNVFSTSPVWEPTHFLRSNWKVFFIPQVRIDCCIFCTATAYRISICIVTDLSVNLIGGQKFYSSSPAQHFVQSINLNCACWIKEICNLNFFAFHTK